jgi:hypothetical protein
MMKFVLAKCLYSKHKSLLPPPPKNVSNFVEIRQEAVPLVPTFLKVLSQCFPQKRDA